jgi:phosphatidylinositol alpha-mannosyltransferase
VLEAPAPAIERDPAERLRVCMLVTYDLSAPGGGVKQHAVDLAASLRARGDDVMIVGPSSKPVNEPGVRSFGGVVNVVANGSDNHLGIFVSPLAVRRFFKRNRFDVVHVHEPVQPSLSYWATWFSRDVAHVATFHAYMEHESRMLLWARAAWSKTLFPFFQRAIAVSDAAQSYASVIWKRHLEVIPNGVSTSRFSTPPSGVIPLPRPADAPVRLLFVGRIGDARKGARYLFDAFRELRARRSDVTLDVVGEQGAAAAPPDVPGLTYHGAVDNARLVELYRGCDVFVAPSTGGESFGIVLIEAMSAGKPVVCSDIDGYRAVAQGPGVVLAPPGDVGALAGALDHVSSLDAPTRRHLGELNRRRARQYDWSAIVERVRAEYLAAIATRAVRK